MTQARSSATDALKCSDHAGPSGNVAATCRIFGISRRISFYVWRNRAEEYGLAALVPSARP